MIISLITGTNGLYFAFLFLTSYQLQLRAWPMVLSGLIFYTNTCKCLEALLISLVSSRFSTSILSVSISSQKILAHKTVTWLQAPFNKTVLLQDRNFYVFKKKIFLLCINISGNKFIKLHEIKQTKKIWSRIMCSIIQICFFIYLHRIHLLFQRSVLSTNGRQEFEDC